MTVKAVTLKSGKTRYRVRHGHNGRQITFDNKREALAYVKGKPVKKLVNRPSWGSGWQGYVVPTPLLRDFIFTNVKELGRTDKEQITNEDAGWRRDLCERIGRIRNMTTEAALRRLFDVTTAYSAVTAIDYADAACLALGMFIDHDTDIPTLPGNKHTAREMIQVRAETLGLDLHPKEEREMAERLHRISLLIINYPHNTHRLVKLAPLNCLGGEE